MYGKGHEFGTVASQSTERQWFFNEMHCSCFEWDHSHHMGICSPLQNLGFEVDILSYLKFCALSLDKVVQLCTTAYLPWRIHIYLSIAACYDGSHRNFIVSLMITALARSMRGNAQVFGNPRCWF